ncbi:MAG: right-handed parallel beta-helix repeat-containing protein, partial [Candidatus Heimdallarchaeota archaeon]|nr:right-handed parallel beta-helix repeat-containing protein [Candidatus Heimdallarchaeota archaeon]
MKGKIRLYSRIITVILVISTICTLLIINSVEIRTLSIDSDADLGRISSRGSGTQDDPYIIEKRRLGVFKYEVKEKYILLEIQNTTKFFVIKNCKFYGGYICISLKGVENGTASIIQNTFYGGMYLMGDIGFNTGIGIEISNTTGVNISDNIFAKDENEDDLIGCSVSIDNSFDCLILNNTFSIGIVYFRNSGNIDFKDNQYNVDKNIICSECSQINIINNQFADFSRALQFWSTTTIIFEYNIIQGKNFAGAVWFNDCSDVILRNNEIIKLEFGIIMKQSDNCIITENVIAFCDEFCIKIE